MHICTPIAPPWIHFQHGFNFKTSEGIKSKFPAFLYVYHKMFEISNSIYKGFETAIFSEKANKHIVPEKTYFIQVFHLCDGYFGYVATNGCNILFMLVLLLYLFYKVP